MLAYTIMSAIAEHQEALVLARHDERWEVVRQLVLPKLQDLKVLEFCDVLRLLQKESAEMDEDGYNDWPRGVSEPVAQGLESRMVPHLNAIVERGNEGRNVTWRAIRLFSVIRRVPAESVRLLFRARLNPGEPVIFQATTIALSAIEPPEEELCKLQEDLIVWSLELDMQDAELAHRLLSLLPDPIWAISRLREMLQVSEPSVQLRALWILGAFGERLDDETVTLVESYIQSDVEPLRMAAMELLVVARPLQVRDRMLAALTDQEADQARLPHVCAVIGKLGKPAFTPPVREALARLIASHEDVEVRRAALDANDRIARAAAGVSEERP